MWVEEVTTGKQELGCNKKKLKCFFLLSETALALLYISGQQRWKRRTFCYGKTLQMWNPSLDEYLLWVWIVRPSWDRHTDTHLLCPALLLLLCQLTGCPNSTSLLWSTLAFPFPGNPACQWDPTLKEICQKGKFQFPPQNICLSAELCSASRSHFSEHSYCPQSTISAWMMIPQREHQHPPEHHLGNLH